MARRPRKPRIQAVPLFASRHGEAHCRANRLCVECGDPLEGRRTRWCSDECVRAYQVRQGGTQARRLVYDRDRGVCDLCGRDTDAIRREVRDADREGDRRWAVTSRPPGTEFLPENRYRRPGKKLPRRTRPGSRNDHRRIARQEVLEGHGFTDWWWRASFWDMDHRVAVKDGGAQSSLADLRTLCAPCHRERTREQNSGPRRTRARRVPRFARETCTGCEPEARCLGCVRYRERVLGARP